MTFSVRKNVIITLLALLFPVISLAQGGRLDNIVLNGQGHPIGGAKIAICTQPASTVTQPCSPLLTVFTDSTDGTACNGTLQPPPATPSGPASSCSNPLTSDGFGNYHFYAPLGTLFTVQIYGPGITTKVLQDQSVGSSSGSGVGSPVNSVQVNIAGALTGAPGMSTPDNGNSLSIKGPAPWTDVTQFGARAVNGPSQTTANFNSGNTTVTIAVPAVLTGNGVTIQGAGVSQTMGTPGGVAVTPQYSNSPTRDHLLANSPAGASTYTYCVVAEDRGQGLTPCSTPVTINTGPSVLGKQTAAISSETLSNDTLTVNTASGTFVGGMMVDVLSGVPRFSGPMRTTSGGANTFTVANYVYDSRVTPSNVADVPNSTSAAGTVVFYQANTISWNHVAGSRRLWICAARPGDGGILHVIGQSDMSYDPTGWQINQFEDYGAAYLAGQAFPYYIKDSICTGSGQADALTTTVVSSGSGTIVVANAPSQTDNTNTKVAILDNGPAFKAASAQAANGVGCMFIPPVASTLLTFAINSLTLLNSGICIIQAGGVQLNDTLELNNAHWVGWNQAGVPAFGFTRGAVINENTANPAVHLIGTGNDISNITAGANINGATMFVVDNATSILNAVNCQLNPANDFLGICVQYRNTSATIDQHKILNGSSFTSGLPQTTDISWTPLIDIPLGQDGSGNNRLSGTKLDVDNFSGNRRGISFASGGFSVNLSHYYVQGNITPQLTFYQTAGGNTPLSFTDVLCDTSGQPMLADLGGGADVYFHTNVSCSATNPIISGTRPSSTISDGYFYAGLGNPPARSTQNCNVNTTMSGAYESNGIGVAQQVCYYGNLLAMLGGYPIYWPLSPPATPTLAGPNAGGSMPSGTFEYAVSATGFDGGETIPSPIPSSSITTSNTCPGAGNCTVTVNWVPVVGALSYNIWRCLVASGCTGGGLPFVGGGFWFEVGLHQTGTSFNDTVNAPTNNVFAQQTGTGSSGMNNLAVWSPELGLVEEAAPSGISGTGLCWEDSGTHLINCNMNNAGTQTLARYIISPVNAQCTNWSGTTGLLGQVAGQCSFHTVTPTNGDCVTWVGTTGLQGDSGSACGAGGGGLNTNMNNMANPTSMSQGLTCSAVNTCFAGSQTVPFTNYFIGTVANQSGSFNSANLTANRVINIPDATSSPVRDCPAVANQFITAIAVATGICTQSLINATQSSVTAYIADSGAVNAYVATLSPAIVAYAAGLRVRFLPANANTITNPTLNVNGLGAITITKFGQAVLQANDLITTAVAEVVYDGTDFELQNPATLSNVVTTSSVGTFTNKTINCESTGNNCSEPVRAFIQAAGCSNSTPGPTFDIGVTNQPTPQCAGSTVRKGVLQFARGNVAYINLHLPNDWNSGASADIEMCFTTTDTTNGHVTSFNIQTGFNKVDGTATDDPALNALQALSVTTGAAQISGGELCGKLTAMTMTGSNPDYNFEIAITRNNSGTDTNTDTAVAVKSAELILGVTKNAANR